MGFFDQFNTTAEAVSTNPFFVPKNDYAVAITKAEVKTFSDIPYLVLEYTITDNPQHNGKNASTMLRLIPWTSAERPQGDHDTMNMRLLSSYKKTLLELGIAEAMLNAFDPNNVAHTSKLLGIRGVGKIETVGDYTNIKDFQRSVVTPMGEAVTAASTVPAGAPEAVPDAAALDALLSGFGG